MEKSDTGWVTLTITGVVLILLAGFNTGVPIWLNYLGYVFLPGGVIALILAAFEFRKRNKFESETADQDIPETRWLSRFLAILILVALLIPHSLGISRLNQPDNSYIRYTVSAVLWAMVHESGSTIVGPYTNTSFEFLSIPTLLLGALFLPLYVSVIITQWRFIKGITTRRTILRVIGLTLIIQVFLQIAFLGYQLDGWASLQTYPLPIFHTLNALSVVRQPKSGPKGELSLRSTVSNSIISLCFWCVSIVFFVFGILVVSNFFSGGLIQPFFAFSQLLLGLVFLALATIVIIMESRSRTVS